MAMLPAAGSQWAQLKQRRHMAVHVSDKEETAHCISATAPGAKISCKRAPSVTGLTGRYAPADVLHLCKAFACVGRHRSTKHMRRLCPDRRQQGVPWRPKDCSTPPPTARQASQESVLTHSGAADARSEAAVGADVGAATVSSSDQVQRTPGAEHVRTRSAVLWPQPC